MYTKLSSAGAPLALTEDMQKPTVQTCYKLFLTALMMIIVSCAQSSETKSGKGPDGTKTPAAPASTSGSVPAPTHLGTGDGAGGNGDTNKMYESYRRDPTRESAFQTFLLPMYLRFEQQEEDRYKNKNKYRASELDWIKSKTWFFAPVDLPTLNKHVVGVQFIKGTTQQLAIQTLDEVWFDSRAFDAMSPLEQADALQHEISVLRYMHNFLTRYEICKEELKVIKRDDCEEKKFENYTPSEPPGSKFEKQDYRNVRGFTSYVMDHLTTISDAEYARQARLRNFKEFDEWFYQPLSVRNQLAVFDWNHIQSLYRQGEFNRCVNTITGKRFNCDFQMKLESHDYGMRVVFTITLNGKKFVTYGTTNSGDDKVLYPKFKFGRGHVVGDNDAITFHFISETDRSPLDRKIQEYVHYMVRGYFHARKLQDGSYYAYEFIGFEMFPTKHVIKDGYTTLPADPNEYPPLLVTNKKEMYVDQILKQYKRR